MHLLADEMKSLADVLLNAGAQFAVSTDASDIIFVQINTYLLLFRMETFQTK